MGDFDLKRMVELSDVREGESFYGGKRLGLGWIRILVMEHFLPDVADGQTPFELLGYHCMGA